MLHSVVGCIMAEIVLSPQEITLLLIIGAALALIVSNRLRPDIVALLVLLILPVTKLVSYAEATSGLSRSIVFTLIGLFIITYGLENTGVVQAIANHIRRIGGGSEARLVFLFMAAGALLSLVMNNIAAGAVLLPAASQVGRDANVRLSKLLIPLSFGTLVGGMATYFTTANIILSGILQEQGQHSLNMADFLLTGGLIVLAALVYMLLIGRRLLPNRESVGQNVSPRSLSQTLYDTYHLDERLWEVRVPPASRLVNCPISHSHIGEELGVAIIAIWRGNRAILAPSPTEVIQANDYLLLLGRKERIDRLVDWGVLVGRENGHRANKHDYAVDLSEVVIPPHSSVIGKTLKNMRFRNKFGMTTVALWREGQSYRTDVGTMPLKVGDALLMVGPARNIRSLSHERDFMVLQSSHLYRPPLSQYAPWALLILAVVLVLSISEIIALPIVMFGGAIAMVLTGCVNMDEAYRAVEWRVIFLIVGMLPISIAMVNTGLTSHVGRIVTAAILPYGSLALITGMFLLTMLLTQLIGGQVTALVIGPVAITSALQTGVNPQAMAVAVAIACSTAFLTPLAHPVNILMMGPGGYRFSDFFKVGVGMTLVTLAGVLLSVVGIWGIH